jgi:4-hydroxy-tetrahydrodipicolinate reductase
MHDETIEITHLANSRKIFAIGAITAIKWIHNQKPGLYSLSNI